MSAVAAILRFRGEPVRDGEIENLIEAMRARAPDGITMWREGSIALAHGRLHGTPESLAEQQPLAGADGRYRMIWDGRLDNRHELRHDLELHRVVPRDETDPELVLQTYLLYGEKTPERLLGDFAFAVSDSVDKRIFCARDHVGARPLYYALNDDFFAMASEDEALLTLPGMSLEPCDDRLIYALVPSFEAFDWQQSWLRDVRILMPGTRISIDSSRRFRRNRYWQLPFPAGENKSRSMADFQGEFADVFAHAVSNRLRSHKPVAAMMSGGMDSASICAMAMRLIRERGGNPLSTFSAVEDDVTDCIESQSILKMADRLGVNANVLRVPSFTGFASREDIARIAEQFAHPTDSSIPLVGIMCLGASRAGHRVLLHGATGDVASHTPLYYLSEVMREAGWRAALRELKLSSQHHTYLAGLGLIDILLRNAFRFYAPSFVKRLRIVTQEQFGSGRDRWSTLAPHFVESRRLVNRIIRSRVSALAVSTNGTREHRSVIFPVGVMRGLEGYERVGGHFGIEMRDPWSDRRVLELMLRLPVAMKTGDGWTKRIVRQEFERDVGPDVVWRSDKPHLGWRFHIGTVGSEEGQSVPPSIQSMVSSAYCGQDSQSLMQVSTIRAWLGRLAVVNARQL